MATNIPFYGIPEVDLISAELTGHEEWMATNGKTCSIEEYKQHQWQMLDTLNRFDAVINKHSNQ